ncbi:MAG TPA: APC family permease [Ktedonobacteraceae bacterium]|nr:APC family permease [Ktedonobacteraceae bacterium]
MEHQSVTKQAAKVSGSDEQSHDRNLLGPLLCWAVVFADIGTSVYYTPGILYQTVGKLAGFFVLLTMTVFVLLTLKYAEVTHRFPQGGGVVTVAAQAINHWVGALGGMFILVDYFLTAAISCLSGMIYLSVVVPAIGPIALWITIIVLVLLGLLNWVGISESAKVSLVGAVIAFLSDLVILYTVFTHISLGQFFALFGEMFRGNPLTPTSILVGFAGSFLAFSGLESISQLSPVMRTPRKRVAGIALLLVVLTIGLTSPLLTMLSTLLVTNSAGHPLATDPVLSGQLISLLGGKWGGVILGTEVAISASALLVFASNTAIIGAYHVFMALSRMEFFPAVVLKRNKLRGTPHYSIALATGIPIIILIIVRGNINILGDMYAFGLLGAFTLTCLGLDIVRHRERRLARRLSKRIRHDRLNGRTDGTAEKLVESALHEVNSSDHQPYSSNNHGHDRNGVEEPIVGGIELSKVASLAAPRKSLRAWVRDAWYNLDYWLGVMTTALVFIAWSTNLVSKPLATAFGGTVATLGMAVAYSNYARQRRRGRLPVISIGVEGRLPDSILAVLTAGNGQNEMVIRSAIKSADGKPVIFLYVGEPQTNRRPQMFEVFDPYLEDAHAKEYFGKAEQLASKYNVNRRFLYRQQEPGVVSEVWQVMHPHDTIIAAQNVGDVKEVNPDRIRYELVPGGGGKVAHLLKRW